MQGLRTDLLAFKVRSGPGRFTLPLLKRSLSVKGAEFHVQLQKGKFSFNTTCTCDTTRNNAMLGYEGGGLGFQLAELRSNKEACRGVFIKKIAPGSPADECGLLRYVTLIFTLILRYVTLIFLCNINIHINS